MGLFNKTSGVTPPVFPNKVPDSARLDLIAAEIEDFKSRHPSLRFHIFLTKAIEQILYAKTYLKVKESRDE